MSVSFDRRVVAIGFALLVCVIAMALVAAVVALPTQATGLLPEVQASLDRAGAENAVTAVLLNYRGYDTLLELTVMLLAVLGARALTLGGRTVGGADGKGSSNASDELASATDDPLLQSFVRLMIPIMVVIAGYLLWVGGHAPGGAFQAGAILAALGILLQLAAVRWWRRISESCEKWLLTGGVAVFLSVGVAVMSPQRAFLQYPVSWSKWLILLIESVATISIAAILIALYRSGSLQDSRGDD